MTRQILSTPTDDLFFDLVDLVSRDYVSTADSSRIQRLTKIVAARRGLSVETVLEAARVEALAV